MKPSLSILLLCWNHAAYLEECIAGIANQTDRDFEVIFLDNVSTDGSFELAGKLFAQYGVEATLLRNDVPQGISKNANTLRAHSSGEIICHQSTDDYYFPRFVEAMRAAAVEHPEALWLFGGHCTYLEGEGLDRQPIERLRDGIVPLALFPWNTNINQNGCAFRRDAIEAIGGYDEAQPVEDLDLTFRLALRGPCHLVREWLAVYRLHRGGVSKNVAFMADALTAFYDKHGSHFPGGGKRALSEAIRVMGAAEVDQRRFGAGADMLRRAFVADMSNTQVLRSAAYLARARLVRSGS